MAALDTLVLGSFIFTDFAIPDELPGGGKQQVKLHKMPGGDRTADTMGPDDNDRVFQFTIFSGDAQAQVLMLDGMRIAGFQWPYSNGIESRIVVIAEFTWKFEKFNVAHCSITLTPLDNPAGAGGSSNGGLSGDAAVGQDLGAASSTGSANVATQGGIGSDAVAGGSISSTQSVGPGGIGHA